MSDEKADYNIMISKLDNLLEQSQILDGPGLASESSRSQRSPDKVRQELLEENRRLRSRIQELEAQLLKPPDTTTQDWYVKNQHEKLNTQLREEIEKNNDLSLTVKVQRGQLKKLIQTVV